MRLSARLVNAQQASTWLRSAYDQLKPWLLAEHIYRVTIMEDNRSLEQNAKFHAICGDIAASGLKWAGKERSAKQWKVLLVSGHAAATGEGAEMVPGLENEFVNIRESTALMTKKRGSSLIEYSLAFCSMHNIRTKVIRHE
jgi:NinB protein